MLYCLSWTPARCARPAGIILQYIGSVRQSACLHQSETEQWHNWVNGVPWSARKVLTICGHFREETFTHIKASLLTASVGTRYGPAALHQDQLGKRVETTVQVTSRLSTVSHAIVVRVQSFSNRSEMSWRVGCRIGSVTTERYVTVWAWDCVSLVVG